MYLLSEVKQFQFSFNPVVKEWGFERVLYAGPMIYTPQILTPSR